MAAETQGRASERPGASEGLPEEVDLNSQDAEQHRPKSWCLRARITQIASLLVLLPAA